MSALDPETSERLAAIGLGHIERAWPYAPQHVVAAAGDYGEPRAFHPVFFGSFDWHSSVHTHWLLASLLNRFPDLASAGAIRARFARAFTDEAVAAECAYFERPTARGFERPYGWAWLLALAAELARIAGAEAAGWSAALAPLETVIATRFADWLPRADYPVRSGAHANTAFALALALDWADARGAGELAQAMRAKAGAWYGEDRDCQAWEPSGDDFLSPALVEAACMGRVLNRGAFRAWFAGFLPRAGAGEPATLFAPPKVSDRSDGKIAHLDGLSLSRAWCWREIAAALAPGDGAATRAREAASRHLAAALPHLAADYMGEHWLASFALMALLAPE